VNLTERPIVLGSLRLTWHSRWFFSDVKLF
jgi:hypothetical protein